MTYRTAQLDPDNRRFPKTDDFCIRCQKDFKPGQQRRLVHVEDSSFATVVHPADEFVSNGDMGWFSVGMDCARKIGLEFTKEA